MIDQFQKLDALIVEHTKQPVRILLRNQLALTREQVEAYQASSNRQDQTLAAQAETITALQQAKSEVEKQLADLKAKNQMAFDDSLATARRKHREFIKGHQLNYDR